MRKLAFTLALALAPTPIVAQTTAAAGDARLGAWRMVAGEPSSEAARRSVKVYTPVFAQSLSPSEVAVVGTAASFPAQGLPLAKTAATVTIAAGTPFYRMATSDPQARVYCGGGVGYSASGGILRVSLRTCLADDDGDRRFDRYMTGMVVPTKPVDSLLLALLRIDTAGIGPVLIGSRPDNRVSISYDLAPATPLFAGGPVLVRSGKKYGLALGIGDDKAMRLLRPFDPAREPPPSADTRYQTPKSFGFEDAVPVDLSRLPVDVDFRGARLRIHAVKGDTAEIEVLNRFPAGTELMVAYTGLLDSAALRGGS